MNCSLGVVGQYTHHVGNEVAAPDYDADGGYEEVAYEMNAKWEGLMMLLASG